MKLSPVGMSGNILSTINWGVIFLPSWILFIICPFLGCLGELPFIMGLMVIIWTPLLIILICITVKLDRQENQGHGPDIRMAYIFIPFWIIEGSCMILSLIFFSVRYIIIDSDWILAWKNILVNIYFFIEILYIFLRKLLFDFLFIVFWFAPSICLFVCLLSFLFGNIQLS